MRAFRTHVARACLRLYPRRWQDRYADELLLLVEEADGGIGDLVDLAIGGLRRRADELHGGAPMPTLIRSATLILAAAVALPAAAFIGLQLIIPDVRAAPAWTNWLIPLLPVLGLLVALGPIVRVGMRRDEAGGMTVTARVLPMQRALLAVVALCLALIGVVAAYGVSENLLR